ncbi:MAG: phage holin family protein [Gammaproteobacteria bacterium]|nr:phage holin family protein [Gammaproteobacteria bacterium]
MNPDEQHRGWGPFSRIVGSVSRLLATVVGIGRTRLELLTVEVREELQRTTELLAWGFVALLAAGAGIVFAALAVIFVFWDTHRILASILVASGFFALAVAAAVLVRARLQAQSQFLQATLAELARDEEELRGRSE